MLIRSRALNLILTYGLAAAPALSAPSALSAQATANTTQRGTVKSVAANAITIATDANAELTVTPADGARILQLAPGSTDLKSAQTIVLSDISAGDRVLVTGHPGDAASTISAARIILMKSSDIASLHASQSADWQKRGTGGLVKAVDGGTITVSNGAKTLTIATTPTTVYRRYAGDSVKFEDAKPSSPPEIAMGDQIRVRGAKSDDGATVTAEEIVSGSFQNLAGAISKVDAAEGTVTLKDLASKQTFTVRVTANSNLRHLPTEAAAAFARSHPADGKPASASAEAGQPASGQPASGQLSANRPAGDAPSGRRAGMDLSQMLARLPAQPLAELKPGDAVLIVASRAGGSVTAVTMLSGVEQILSASPGASAPALSPWSLGGGEMESAGGSGGGGR